MSADNTSTMNGVRRQGLTLASKIGGGFALVLGLLVALGVIGWFAIRTSQEGFAEYREMARDSNLTSELRAHMLMVRMNVKEYLLANNDKDIEQYKEHRAWFNQHLAKAKSEIQKPSRAALIASVNKEIHDYEAAFEQIIAFMTEGHELVTGTLNVKGPYMEKTLAEILVSAEEDNDMSAAFHSGLTMRRLLLGRLYMSKFLDTNDHSAVNRVYEEYEKMQAELDILDKELQNPQRREWLSEVQAAKNAYVTAFETLTKVIKDRNAVIRDALDKIGPEIAADLEAVNKDIGVEQETIGPSLITNMKTSEMLVIGVALGALFLGAILACVIVRSIQRQVGGEPSEIANITERIAQGDFDIEIGDAESRTGILQSVGTMAAVLQQTKIRTEQQDWFKTGQNKLNEVMRGDLTVYDVTENVICFLAEYLDAQIGAVYISQGRHCEADANTLTLEGSYAFTLRKGMKDTLAFGQGLVGQVASSKKMIVMTELPHDATHISSATVDAVPRNVVVLPLLMEGDLLGVIELGCFGEFSPQALEFLTSVSEAISTGVNSAQRRLQMQQVLEKAKQQANALQAQQGELEAANQSLEQKTAVLQEQKIRSAERTKELQAAYAAAQAADRTKSEFLANMSHEIRTPMTAILGFADILMTEDGIELAPLQRREAISTIHRNGEHLIGIIDDILDLSKIETGTMDFEKIEFSPSNVLQDVVTLMEVRAKAKGLQLEIENDGPLPEVIQSDPTRFRQILINIVGNAIKFTETGKIRVVARLSNANSDSPKLQIDVIDSGIGLTEEQVGKLFQPFVQADSSITRKFGGTGLGLAISKRFAEALGGGVEVKSVLGQGSTFTVNISTGSLAGVAMVDESTETKAPAEKVGKKATTRFDCRVLLAEDGPDNQRLISFILKKAGADVTVAENGQIAHDLALAARDEAAPFDVILMDMQMPVMDGYTATGKLRAAGYTFPIVALTAHAMNGDRETCINAGCDDYTTKPIDRDALISLVAQYASQQRTEEVVDV